MKTLRDHQLSHREGFTLLEIMLAMAIFMMMCTALFAIINTSVRAASSLEKNQNRSQQISGFIDLCQQSFRTLPASATIMSETREDGGQFVRVLTFENAPNAFNWGDPNFSPGPTTLSPRPQVGGLFSLAISHQSQDGEGKWLNLVNNVRDLSWRFLDSRSGAWANEWKDTSFRPALIEMTLSLAEDEKPIKYTFWVPPITKQGEP